jgi:hypothetical protein
LKALIIENEYVIPQEIKDFLKANRCLFTEVDVQLGALHRTLKDLSTFMEKADAIIAYSTFVYMDQLEMLTLYFEEQRKAGKVYKFYVHNIIYYLKRWRREYGENSRLVAAMINLVVKSEVYDFLEDKVSRINYSPEDGFFEASSQPSTNG